MQIHEVTFSVLNSNFNDSKLLFLYLLRGSASTVTVVPRVLDIKRRNVIKIVKKFTSVHSASHKMTTEWNVS